MALLYSLFDRKARQFGPIVVERTEGSVRRSLEAGIPGSGSIMEKYPDDYDLYLVGSFDEDVGLVEGCAPRCVDNLSRILGGSPAVEPQLQLEVGNG